MYIIAREIFRPHPHSVPRPFCVNEVVREAGKDFFAVKRAVSQSERNL